MEHGKVLTSEKAERGRNLLWGLIKEGWKKGELIKQELP